MAMNTPVTLNSDPPAQRRHSFCSAYLTVINWPRMAPLGLFLVWMFT